MTRLLKYIGYFTLSLIMALISFFAGEERDFLFMFSKNLIPVLIGKFTHICPLPSTLK